MTTIHERTRTSIAVKEIETTLARKLRGLAATIRRDAFFPFNIEGLKQKYGTEVLLTIQSAIQQSYVAAIEYVSEFEKVPALLSARDISSIERQSAVEAEAFWRTITRDTQRQQIPIPLIPGLTRSVNMPAAVGLLAAAATFGVLSLATLSKTRQLDQDATITWITALDERVCPICRPLHGKVWSVGDSTLRSPIRDTHPNCRCRLLLKNGRSIFSH